MVGLVRVLFHQHQPFLCILMHGYITVEFTHTILFYSLLSSLDFSAYISFLFFLFFYFFKFSYIPALKNIHTALMYAYNNRTIRLFLSPFF